MSDERLQVVFRRVFRQEFDGSNLSVSEVPAWDSLSHIKLVMDLEREFFIEISPEEIPELYSDYDTVQDFIMRKLAK